MRIRPATFEDLEGLVELGEAMRKESVIKFPPVEPERVEHFLDLAATLDGEIACFVAEDDVLVGFMVCLMSYSVFTSVKTGFHHVFYVKPEKRGSVAALFLVRAYEDWAKKNGAEYVEIAVDTGLFPEKTGKFYERMGYQHMGGKYGKALGEVTWH